MDKTLTDAYSKAPWIVQICTILGSPDATSATAKLVDSVDVYNNIQKLLPGGVSALPQNEKAVRPLASLSVEDQQAVWGQGLQGSKWTSTR